MKDIEVRLARNEELVRRMNVRLQNILNSRAHYLKFKAAKNNVTMSKLRALVQKLERFEKVLGHSHLTMESREGTRTAVMFTAYERQRLRALLKSDYKHVFKCSASDSAVLEQMIEGARA